MLDVENQHAVSKTTAQEYTAVKPFEQILRDGFAVVPGILRFDEVEALQNARNSTNGGHKVRRNGTVFGVRNLIDVPAIRELCQDARVKSLAAAVIGPACKAVRATLFDKTSAVNWKVPFHQDLTIAVRERRNIDGFGPWSVKGGVAHVQPPISIMEGMISVRLHLDDCTLTNGPLRVLPGSHQLGRLSAIDIQRLRAASDEVMCVANLGDALVMFPLLLHASAPASYPGHRRVIHIDYSGTRLPGGLEWRDAV